MKKFKIGLQLYGIRDAMEQDLEGALKAVKEMGYDYVEYAGGNYGRSWQEIGALLDKYDLKCVSVHQGIETFMNNPDASLEQIRALGAEYCAICMYYLDNYINRWDESMDKITCWARGMGEHGIKAMYHNHAFEFELIDGEHILDKMFTQIPRDLLKPELDVAWVHYGGVDPVAYLDQYPNQLEVIHLKDFACHNLPNEPVFSLVKKHGRSIIPPTRKEAGFEYLPVGSGIQDWPAILAACERSGAEYLIVEQDESKGCTQLEAAKRSLDYLRGILC